MDCTHIEGSASKRFTVASHLHFYMTYSYTNGCCCKVTRKQSNWKSVVAFIYLLLHKIVFLLEEVWEVGGALSRVDVCVFVHLVRTKRGSDALLHCSVIVALLLVRFLFFISHRSLWNSRVSDRCPLSAGSCDGVINNQNSSFFYPNYSLTYRKSKQNGTRLYRYSITSLCFCFLRLFL